MTDSPFWPSIQPERIAMRKFLRCCDIIPGCSFIARGVNENEVIIRAARHARAVHNVPWMTPELLKSVLAAIRDDDMAIVEG